MNKSESIKALAGALSKAQAEMTGAKKTTENTFFHSSYSDLSSIISAAKTGLANNNLSVSQFPITKEGYAGVITILMHESGEFMESELLLKVDKLNAQGMGSAITYARRYAYQAILGIPSEDDDGNGASKVQAPKPAYKEPVKAAAKIPLPTPAPAAKPSGPSKKAILDAFKACTSVAALKEKSNKAAATQFANDKDVNELYAIKLKELTK